MNARRFFGAFLLALALLAGQQAAALHDLMHAGEQLGQKSGTPAKHTCDQCFLSAQLSGAVGTHVAPAFTVPADGIDALPRHNAVELPSTPLSFRSRAPPLAA